MMEIYFLVPTFTLRDQVTLQTASNDRNSSASEV
jgi:hypothetical protein